jgi:hypothetical protein
MQTLIDACREQIFAFKTIEFLPSGFKFIRSSLRIHCPKVFRMKSVNHLDQTCSIRMEATIIILQHNYTRPAIHQHAGLTFQSHKKRHRLSLSPQLLMKFIVNASDDQEHKVNAQMNTTIDGVSVHVMTMKCQALHRGSVEVQPHWSQVTRRTYVTSPSITPAIELRVFIRLASERRRWFTHQKQA